MKKEYAPGDNRLFLVQAMCFMDNPVINDFGTPYKSQSTVHCNIIADGSSADEVREKVLARIKAQYSESRFTGHQINIIACIDAVFVTDKVLVTSGWNFKEYEQ